MTTDEERIALFLDYENLAIGAREDLRGMQFALRPLADALAERGRVVVRRAYADWSYFDDDRRMLTKENVELIEIPQRMGAVRKNAADIKMAVDAVELVFERDYITTFVICTGDSDFTPLVNKLRELNKRVIGVGLEASTSNLLPPACDEFLFYERIEGVDLPRKKKKGGGGRGRGGGGGRPSGGDSRREPAKDATPPPPPPPEEDDEPTEDVDRDTDIGKLVTQTLSGLQRSADGVVLASGLKRAMIRKDPTFNEADFGFRGFGEMLRDLESKGVVELSVGPAKGDPEVSFPEASKNEEDAFALLRRTVEAHAPTPLSGLKDKLRAVQPDFSEKRFGFGGFLQFCKAARTRDIISMEWDDEVDDYVLAIPSA
ncbi:NYN domain-containing protein [Euzebya sp.]|uniref:NYN domain-containing protein n=1 Tax=Euzebya sp. TaxID=1971409 RepID=UPI0035163B9C